MPAGSDQIISNEWQPVPGAPDASIFPFIRKIDTISSNNYLIVTPDVILLIDPGGLPAQVEQMAKLMIECREEKDRPVFVFLTHAHIDHFIGVQQNPEFAFPETAVFAVQQAGASALEQGDTRLTQASLLHTQVFPMKIGLHLFTMDRSEMPGITGSLSFSNGAEITITRTTGPAGLPCERICFGSGPCIEVFHTPGHSPDSICLRVGDLLFIGDLLFAANPGVAGLAGWSQADLLRSLDAMTGLITEDNIRFVLPGHGKVLGGDDAGRMLGAIRRDAAALTDIAELNHERAERTAAFAEDCIEEVNELFTIMAGRLYYTSYLMEELGEAGMAEEASSLIKTDTIDELLEAFRTFAEEHHRKSGQTPVHLVLKAGQVIGKLERTFNRDELAGIIDPSLIQRAARLLSDYTTMLRGFSPPAEISRHDLISLTGGVVTGLSVSACSDEEVLLSSDDDAAFSRMLLSRIGTRPLLEDVETEVRNGGTSLIAWVDRDHYVDLLTYILEDLVGTGAEKITISSEENKKNAVITISGSVPDEATDQKRRTWRFLEGLGERTGGTLELLGNKGVRTFTFTVPAAEPTSPGGR